MFLIIFGDDYVYFYHYLGGPLSCNQLLSDIFCYFKAAESKFKTINNASSQLPPAVALWWWNHFARIMTSKDRRAGCPVLPLLQPVHGKEAKSASQNCFYNCKVNNKIHYIIWRPIKQILMRNILWDYNIRMHEVEMNNRYFFHDNYLWVKNWWLKNQWSTKIINCYNHKNKHFYKIKE